MKKPKISVGQLIGLLFTASLTIVFVRKPSFPTPDKIIIYLFFFFMIFRQALFMLKRLLPFVIILLVYDSFRGAVDQLNTYVNYSLPPAFDNWLFGSLPTASLQNLLWDGQVRWYDFVFYFPYLLHFVLPIGLAILIWKTKEAYYFRYIAAFVLVTFTAFFTFLFFPAAPPWLAAQTGHIEPITRISSDVWWAFGLEDFPSIYNHISPNPVAAVPSLHAAWAFLVFLFVYKFYGRKLGLVAVTYPAILFIGMVYQGEHYVFDVALGVLYALAAYLAAPFVVSFFKKPATEISLRHRQGKQTAADRFKNID
ncbi:MAG: phosphatase PAP2 family protein [Candidatus Saccharimonadales bacterium]